MFREGIQIPRDIDHLSAPPEGYKNYVDNNPGGVNLMKTILKSHFPGVTGLQVFHEKKSDVGGQMLVRFFYNGKNIELPVLYNDKMKSITDTRYQDLAKHIQDMNNETRGLFNVIVHHINTLEGRKGITKTRTHAELTTLDEEIQTA